MDQEAESEYQETEREGKAVVRRRAHELMKSHELYSPTKINELLSGKTPLSPSSIDHDTNYTLTNLIRNPE